MFDIIVVGSGAAGLTAALYAQRAGKKVLILEGNSVGGQIAYSPRVENFPTIMEISGSDLSEALFNQAMHHGAELEVGLVEKVEKIDGKFVVTTEFDDTFESKAVILATGVKHRHLGIEQESKLVGKGVCYCAVCDGAFYKDQPVAVLGDGNTALQYALYLADMASEVHLLTLTDKLMGDGKLQQRIANSDKIVWHQNVNLYDIVGQSKVEGVMLRHQDGSEERLPVDALFVAIGQVPDNGKFAHLVDLDRQGYVVADESCTTKTAGLFVAGDCRTKAVRQLTTAVGDGATAATQAVNYINSLD
ncbi:MAG: FAD-dependent oxidoreductase [Clostridia bacterium]|nr:FAD-dependent oxidoreductase [Clostridia bacterium]